MNRVKPCACGDESYHCENGYHHVVPQLARDCKVHTQDAAVLAARRLNAG